MKLHFFSFFLFLFTTGSCQLSFAAPMSPLELENSMIYSHTFKGDFDQIEEKRIIRFLVPYSQTFFFLDGAKPKGFIYDKIISFEKEINKKLKKNHIQLHAIVIPTRRKELIPNLVAGLGDVAAANLTITEDRLQKIDFTDPFLSNINEVIVTHKNTDEYSSIFELSGKTISVRPTSSYYTSLLELNKILHDFELKKVVIRKIHEQLEDEDILELVNANIIHNTVVDKYKADFWGQILPDIKVHDKAAVNKDGKIAWAIRKDSPKLEKVLNEFIKNNKEGTLAGNMLFRKYLKNSRYITNALDGKNRILYEELTPLFKKYGDLYNFDHFLLLALAYQESKLKQQVRSGKGAVGIMQILPSTAESSVVNIPDINNVEKNIHAGTKYLRYLADTYFPESPNMDKTNRTLFTFAAYNAGPGKINYLRRKAAQEGYDPNIWFQNVEIVAARHIGRETVTYVSNILKYYVAYNLFDKKQNNTAFPIKEYTEPWPQSPKQVPTLRALSSQG